MKMSKLCDNMQLDHANSESKVGGDFALVDLRLLTNRTVMGTETRNLRQAWEVYERWLRDSRVEFHGEPNGIDTAFGDATAFFTLVRNLGTESGAAELEGCFTRRAK